MKWFWSVISRLHCFFEHSYRLDYSERQGFRMAKGGRWERWRVHRKLEVFDVWVQWNFQVDGVPIPGLDRLPLEVEDYRDRG